MLGFLVVCCYLIGAVGYFVCAYTRRPVLCTVAWWSVVIGALVHVIDIGVNLFSSSSSGSFSLHRESLSILGLLVMSIFIIVSRLRPFSFAGTFVVPLVLFIIIAASVLPFESVTAKPFLQHGIIMFHVATLFVAYAFFALSFSISLVYLFQERKIKRKEFKSAMTLPFPSLETLDRLNHRCTLVGFPFMTAGLIAGFGSAQFFWKSFWTGDPKEILSLITWLVYAVLFHQRLALGWRGKKASVMSICGFVAVLATFIGVNLYGRTHHVTFFLH